MPALSEDAMRSIISNRLAEKTGYLAKKKHDLLIEIFNRVSLTEGPAFSTTGDYGTEQLETSKYQTWRGLMDYVMEKNTKFSLSVPEILQLKARLKYGNAVVLANKLIEKKTVIETKENKALFQYFFPSLHALKNDPVSIRKKIEEKTKALKIDGKYKLSPVAHIKKALQNMDPVNKMMGLLKILFVGFGGYLSIFEGASCTVACIPLGGLGIGMPTSVQNIEVAHSNKVVKFRAVGSIFLAYQEAGLGNAIKITGKLTGEGRYVFLTALWTLAVITQGYLQPFDWDGDLVDHIASSRANIEAFRATSGPVTVMDKIDDVTVQAPAFEKHLTFPVILEHEIIPNCYVETFSFTETIEGKKDTINYDLLLRTYKDPHEFKSDTEHTLYGSSPATKTHEVMEFGLNLLYRMTKYMKEYFVDNRTWKQKGYYNIDALDVAMVFTMAFGGLIN